MAGLCLVLPRFSSGLFRAMFAMKETENGNELNRRVSSWCFTNRNDHWSDKTTSGIRFGVGHSTLNKWVQ